MNPEQIAKVWEANDLRTKMNVAAERFDSVMPKMENEAKAFKRACFREGWKACEAELNTRAQEKLDRG